MSRLLLCTDLDRTLLPNGPQSESSNARQIFSRLVERDEVTLVYVTGRDQKLVQQAIDEYRIPVPDYVIADVGSTIYQIKNENWQHWQVWEQEISGDWHGKAQNDIHMFLKHIDELQLQEASKQNTHKLSYYVSLEHNPAELIERIKTCLQKYRVNANLIWSIDEAENIGLLDILPASASKRHAIEFLMQQLAFGLNETVFAGDSGNDITVMASPIHSVLVANASEDVRSLAIKQATDNNQAHALYVAQGNFLGMNGNYSAGILEGVAHYLPEITCWMSE